MYIDKENMFSNAQAVTVTAASDVIDLGSPDAGMADDLWLTIRVDTQPTASGAATVAFKLQSDSAEAFNVAVVDHVTVAALGKAALVDNYTVIRTKLPVGIKRYARIYYTVATGPLTGGKFDAFLTRGIQKSHNA